MPVGTERYPGRRHDERGRGRFRREGRHEEAVRVRLARLGQRAVGVRANAVAALGVLKPREGAPRRDDDVAGVEKIRAAQALAPFASHVGRRHFGRQKLDGGAEEDARLGLSIDGPREMEDSAAVVLVEGSEGVDEGALHEPQSSPRATA